MKDKFFLIYDYLQECVNDDIYTEEFATKIAHIAYNKYIVEANAYNKYAELLTDKRKKQDDFNNKILQTFDRDYATKLIRLNEKKIDLNKQIENFNKDSGGNLWYYNSRGEKSNKALQKHLRHEKYKWMLKHGNKGTDPHDRKPGRYLDLQKMRNEERNKNKDITDKLNDDTYFIHKKRKRLP